MSITKLMLAVLMLVAIGAAQVELTDYQKGVSDGLKAGLMMGELKGAAAYDSAKAIQYNEYLAEYNAGLNAIFGDNSTEATFYWMFPVTVDTSGKKSLIVHRIDGSFNQKITGEDRVKGMPYAAYYTTYEAGGNSTTDSLGYV